MIPALGGPRVAPGAFVTTSVVIGEVMGVAKAFGPDTPLLDVMGFIGAAVKP